MSALAEAQPRVKTLERCGGPHVRRDKPALAAPRALDEAAQRRLLRAAEGAPVRWQC